MNTAMDRIESREEKTNRVGDIVKSGNTYGLVTLIDEKKMIGYVIWQDGSCGKFSLYTHLQWAGGMIEEKLKEKLRELFTFSGQYLGEPYSWEDHCLGEEPSLREENE